MCGINGFVTSHKHSNYEQRIEKMNQSLIHRGPNAEGKKYFENGRVALGHRRLSIVDLDARSNQPFCSNDDRYAIVYNGEIYNFKELKNELNFNFRTESDTEVLLAGLICNGIEWIKKCNGMFGFAMYDAENKELILCRDRLGIKPLYYYCDGENFVFSSEIKGILNSGLIKAEFNTDAIDEYLGNRYIREPYTFFKNIYQLPAGSYMIVNDKLELQINRYWELPSEFNMSESYDEEKVYSDFKEELNKAIERRMIADVTVGTYLSGGIDSSIISAVASMNSKLPINTYTIGFPELNEYEYARMVVQKYNTRHHEISMDASNYLDMMEEIIQYKDAPLGVPNEVPLALMSKELRKDITVVLSGEGADELMGGYGRIFRTPFDYENTDLGRDETFYDYFIRLYEYVPREIREKYLSCKYPLRDEYDEMIEKQFKNRRNEENVFRFFHKFHVKGLLQRVDITTMYASVEARVPFLDHELIEYCYKKVPYELKMKWNSEEQKNSAKKMHASEYSEKMDQPKYLIRKYGLELLPSEVVERKKMGFPVPLNEWFSKLERMAKDILKDAFWLRRNAIEELCQDCKKNSRAGQLLWMFINIEIFRKIYFEKEWRY